MTIATDRRSSIARYREHLPVWGALLGMATGYGLLHPYFVVAHEFFHIHDAEHVLHLHWSAIPGALRDSFGLHHLPQAFSMSLLTGALGYLLGRVFLAQQIINDQFRRFAVIGRNLSGILHDAKSPVATIVSCACLLKDEVSKPEHVEYCDAILKQAHRFLSNVQDINLIARPDIRLPLKRAAVDLAHLFRDIASDMGLGDRISIIAGFHDSVSVDKTYFERVVWNLLDNAHDALCGRADGQIKISLERDDDAWVQIQIIDNGPGIPGHVLPRLFELGYTFGKRRGTGIGLYNCKRIVESHGGTIWVSSRRGNGTAVHIRMPGRPSIDRLDAVSAGQGRENQP